MVKSSGATWALVTGGSDGIGLGLCKKLAKDGFNICMVSRNEEKMKQKCEEITKECRPGDSTFETMTVVADFSKIFTIEEYKTTIAEKVSHLDIGIVCLNAGWTTMGTFHKFADWEVEQITQINVNHVIYGMKVLIG